MAKKPKNIIDNTDRSQLFTRFYNEDCVEGARKHLADGSVDLIITDPPYGIEGDQLHRHYHRDESFVIDGYVEIPVEQYGEFSLRWIREAARVLRSGGSMYLVTGWTHLRHVLNAVAETDLQLVNHIIWKYNFGVFTRQKYVTSHYHILYLVKPGSRAFFNTYARFAPSEKTAENRSLLYSDMEDVWIIDREYKTGKVRHKNELPTQLLVKMLQYSSSERDVVCDFFAGSFSTAKIAKALNRSSISFEIGKQAFARQTREVDAVEWGEMLWLLKTGKDDRPEQSNKPWADEEVARLIDLYNAYRGEGLKKMAAIERLQADLQRGYFSVLNALKKQGL